MARSYEQDQYGQLANPWEEEKATTPPQSTQLAEIRQPAQNYETPARPSFEDMRKPGYRAGSSIIPAAGGMGDTPIGGNFRDVEAGRWSPPQADLSEVRGENDTSAPQRSGTRSLREGVEYSDSSNISGQNNRLMERGRDGVYHPRDSVMDQQRGTMRTPSDAALLEYNQFSNSWKPVPVGSVGSDGALTFGPGSLNLQSKDRYTPEEVGLGLDIGTQWGSTPRGHTGDENTGAWNPRVHPEYNMAPNHPATNDPKTGYGFDSGPGAPSNRPANLGANIPGPTDITKRKPVAVTPIPTPITGIKSKIINLPGKQSNLQDLIFHPQSPFVIG